MQRLQRILCFWVSAALMLTLAACGGTPAPSATATPQTRAVVDMDQAHVELTVDGTPRILTCTAVSTMTVLMLGGPEAVASVGQGFDYAEGSLNRKMFPGLDNVPLLTRESINAEEVAKCNATVILMDVPDLVQSLRQLQLPVARSYVTSPETLMQSVLLTGQILGGAAEEKAAAYNAYYQGLIDSARAKTQQLDEADRPLVYYGRVEGGTAGKGSIPDFWIEASGGVNLASKMGLSGSRASINLEELLAADPDIVITETPQLAQIFRTDARYAGLNAVRNGKVYCNPAGWGMGSVDGALQLLWAPSVIQPDLFTDTDIEAATRSFYQTYYGYALSEEDLQQILRPDQA